ncbi:MAG TPA: nickel pincer cofactor biosynthesis protein LarC [Thermoanaerobaculia bacterium]|nr:nickel pincer cofactor biosynthesis protein LarC [Thermoanaerobaculia bacterium]
MSADRLLYHLECPSGLAGDMFLGACLDLGMPLSLLQEAVASLDLPGVEVESRPARRGGVSGTRFRVLLDGVPVEGRDPDEDAPPADPSQETSLGASHGHRDGPPLASHPEHEHHHRHHHHHHHHPQPGAPGRDFAEIRRLIETSGLDPGVRERAVAMFARLAEVEGSIHGIAPERVHFHEVGAIDSIVDVVGACVAFDYLGGALSCGTVVTGGGTVATAHGVLPVPSPATAALLVGIPAMGGGEGELLTPTGALILAELVGSFGPAPRMVPLRHGYGLGRWDPPGRPNVVRLTRGQPVEAPITAEVTVIECQVDDLPGEGAGHAMERLLAEGALDVFFTPAQMKKNRPGMLVTVLCRSHQSAALARLLLAETGSLGCRFHVAQRLEMERSIEEVATRFGLVRVKVGVLDGQELAASPEFEDCRRLALEHGVPWREVHRAAVVARERRR